MVTVTNVKWNGLPGMMSEIFALFCESHKDLLTLFRPCHSIHGASLVAQW